MTLAAQRFVNNATLNRCVDEGYRMFRGEPDREAVKRLQLALSDLGYSAITKVDGIWGDQTDTAVLAYKADERLHPLDAVASVLTISQLDAFYAWEPASPDDPDPSDAGLLDLAQESATTAAAYAEATVGILDTVAWGGPSSGAEEDLVRAALLAHVGLDASQPGADVSGSQLMTLLSGMASKLDPSTGDFVFAAMDSAAWWGQGYSFYWAYLNEPARFVVMPPFRNALPDDERASILLRAAARKVEPGLRTFAFPGSARYMLLEPAERANNPAGVASLVLFVGAGVIDVNRPPPTWGDLTSFPLT